MAKRFKRRLAVLLKPETTYGTDAVPTGAADALQMGAVTFTPMEGEEVQRDLMLPYMGHQGVMLAGIHARLEGEVELAGAGTAGTAPAYGALLRCCGMAQTVTAATKVDYKPVSAGHEAATVYFNWDGTRHVMLGCRGAWTLEVAARQIPKLRFRLLGLLGTYADAALPALTLTNWRRPLIVNKANTPTYTLHGHAADAERLTIESGIEVEPRMRIGTEAIELVDRRVTGTAVIQATQAADRDWLAIALARTRGALSLVHGTGAGNIVEVAAAAVEIGRWAYADAQGILDASLPLVFCPTAGDDEITLTVR